MSKKNLLKNPLVWGIAAIVLVAVIVMAISPTPQPEVVQVPVPVYVCWDNSVVQDPTLCPPQTQQLITATPDMCNNLNSLPLGSSLAKLLGCPESSFIPQPLEGCSLVDTLNPLSNCFIDGNPYDTCWDGSEVADSSLCPPQPCSLTNALTYGQCAKDAQGMAADSICQMSPSLASFMGIMCSETSGGGGSQTQTTQQTQNTCQVWNPFTWGACGTQLSEPIACSVDENLARSIGYSCGYTQQQSSDQSTTSTTGGGSASTTSGGGGGGGFGSTSTSTSGGSVYDWINTLTDAATNTANNIVSTPVNYISDATSGVTNWLSNAGSGVTNTINSSTSGVTNWLSNTGSGITNTITSTANNLQDTVSNWFSGWF